MRYGIAWRAAAMGGLVVASGCHIIDPRMQSTRVSSGTTIIVEAEQRIVASSGKGDKLIICAEPSPDALKVQGGSTQFGKSKSDFTGIEAALAYAESAQFVGLRTQSIQLLRDAMYRACEGLIANAITPSEFVDLHLRFQKLTAVLLATEQLTGAVQPRSGTVISLNATASSGKQLQELTNAVLQAKSELRSLNAKTAALKEAVNAAQAEVTRTEEAHEQAEGDSNATPEDKEKAKGDFEKAKLDLGTAKEDKQKNDDAIASVSADVSALEEQQAKARAGFVGVSPVSFDPSNADRRPPLDTETARVLAESVSSMIQNVFLDDLLTKCIAETPEYLAKRDEYNRKLDDIRREKNSTAEEISEKFNSKLSLPSSNGRFDIQAIMKIAPPERTTLTKKLEEQQRSEVNTQEKHDAIVNIIGLCRNRLEEARQRSTSS